MESQTTPINIDNSAFADWLRQTVADAVSEALRENKKDETVLLPEAEAADFYGLRKQTLAAWRHQGRGPAYVKLGSSIRYNLKDLREYLHAQRVGA